MRKKLLLFLMALLWIPLAMTAEEFVIDGLKFELEDNKAILEGYLEVPTNLVIPSTVTYEDNEYRVTSIGGSAFYNCSSLTSIVIPEGVTSIERYAFWGCSSLTSVVIPEGVTYIDHDVFCGCSSLTSVVIPEGVTSIGEGAFSGCSSLTSVVIPEGVTSIGGLAFCRCSSLTSVVIPEGVTSIGEGAFYGCSSLTSVVIPEGVTSIAVDVFQDCSSLTSVVIPEGVTSIGDSSFYGCSSLISVVLPEGVTSIGYTAFCLCSSLTSVVIPEGVTSIGEQTFYGCSSLTSVVIPEGVTSIGGGAFRGCSSLTSVVIPEGVTSIAVDVFRDCSSLTSVVIPEGVTSIGGLAFVGCSSLAIAIFKCKDVEIGDTAFDYRYGIKIIYPSTIDLNCNGILYPYDENTSIEVLSDNTVVINEGKTLFAVPVIEENYSVPEGVETITSRAFEGCVNIKTLTIPASVRSVEADAFKDIALERVNFVDWPAWYANVKLGNMYSNPYRECGAYAGGVKITTPELKEGLTRIEDYINLGLDGFKDEVEIPSTVKRIGAYAFRDNKELYSVILPDGLEEIGEYAFAGCELLENPKFPESLKKIEAGAYYGCKTITEVSLPKGVEELGSREGNARVGVFESCTALEKANVAVEADYIEDNLFKNCSALNKVYLPTELKTIGSNAFNGCKALEEVVFPATLEEIGNKAFYGGSLTRLVIPSNVKSIGNAAFSDNKIANLKIGSGLEVIPENAFFGNPIKVLSLSEGLTEIQSNAFASNSSLGSVILPSTVTTLAANAFANTKMLELEIPDNVTSLVAGSCGNPSVLTIGSGVKEIDVNAFGLNNLKILRVKSNTPPTLSDAFPVTTDQNDNLTVIVNNGRRNNYVTNARWKQFDNIIEESSSDVIIYMTGDYPLSEEIRTTTGLMPSMVTKMKVVGPLTGHDLGIITQNMISLRSLDMSAVTNVTAIPSGMFAGSLMTDIILPDNLESIGASAFSNCGLLKIDRLPATLKSIGSNAFANSPLVTVSVLPEALETIGENAFSHTGIRTITTGENLEWIGPAAFANNTLLETVDFGESVLTTLPYNIFNGCKALDEIILPSSVVSIGESAFSNTAIRDLAFLDKVESIANNSFRNCRRLVTANLPEKLQVVSSELFADCPRLISVSMPSTTTVVGGMILSNDRKLSNISCASVEAPEAATTAFDNIRIRYVSLTVPTTSFRSYLNALQWGKFQSIQNRIPVVIDEGVEVTNVAEDEYQDMIEEDALEEAQEAAAEERSEEEAEMSRRRVARRAAARAATTRQFAKLFDGAQIQTGSDGSGTLIFITPQEGVTVTSVKFNGKEMISELEGNSLLLPAGSNGQLEIRTNAITTGIATVSGDVDFNSAYQVYNLNGVKVADSIKSLEPGIYIVRQGGAVKKINVN